MTVQTALKSVHWFRNGEVLKMTQKNHCPGWRGEQFIIISHYWVSEMLLFTYSLFLLTNRFSSYWPIVSYEHDNLLKRMLIMNILSYPPFSNFNPPTIFLELIQKSTYLKLNCTDLCCSRWISWCCGSDYGRCGCGGCSCDDCGCFSWIRT